MSQIIYKVHLGRREACRGFSLL